MLKSLELKNFQSHVHSVIEFCPGTNAIVGTSDSGKSSIIRALNWLIFNRPRQHKAYKNYLAGKKDEYSVKGTFDNGWVQRFKTPKENSYRVSTQKEPLAAIRTDVPDEAQAIMGMSDVNLQSQHAPYFLLDNNQYKPSAVASAFNEIAGLEVMDECSAEVAKMVRQLSGQEKQLDKDIDITTEQLEELDWVPQADIQIKKLSALEQTITAVQSELQAIQALVQNAETVQQQLSALPDVNTVKTLCATLSKHDKRIHLKQTKINALTTLCTTYDTTDTALRKIRSVNKEIKAVSSNVTGVHTTLQKTTERIVELTQITTAYTKLRKSLRTVQHITKNLPDITALSDMHTEIADTEIACTLLTELVTHYKHTRRSVLHVKKQRQACECEVAEALSNFEECPLCGAVTT